MLDQYIMLHKINSNFRLILKESLTSYYKVNSSISIPIYNAEQLLNGFTARAIQKKCFGKISFY